MEKPDLTRSGVIRGDAIELLGQWLPGFARLVFADPPFNIGYRYTGYDDARRYDDYVSWSRQWMSACVRALTADGSLYIAIGDDYAAELRILGRELGLTLRNWIIWHYAFGQNTREKFVRAHTHILYFVRDARDCVFNDAALRFPSLRHTEYADRRAKPEGRLPDDVWNEYPRVCGTFSERQGWHGCQMPEALLARIIRASSNPGDVVFDPFAGSGTTPATAVKLGRIGIATEQSAEYAAEAAERVRRAEEQVRADRAGPDGWTEFERECLRQLFRETETPVESLLPNEAAMACIVRCLKARTGRRRAAAEIAGQLSKMRADHQLPRFKNDRPFRPKTHKKAEHAPDRKLKPSCFAGLPSDLRRANEFGRSAG